MKKPLHLIIPAIMLFFAGSFSANAQYCASSNSNTTDEFISNVNFAGINNTTGSTTYQDNTAIVGTVIAGNSYPMSVSVSNATGFGFTETVRIWVDWNQDFDFFDAGEQFDLGSYNVPGTSTVVFSTTIAAPIAALGGVTRVRVTNKYSSYPAPCEMFTYGEVEDYSVNVIPPPAIPPVPTQDVTPPTCIAGSSIDVVGTPAPDVLWYWQTADLGTSTSDPYVGPYSIFSNGTYYLRAYNNVLALWSVNSSSVTVTNFSVAPMPNAPIAALNPACITNGTTISADPAPLGLVYYWQGTNPAGISTLENAATPYNVATTGTYHLRAFETATSCWSDASSVLVNITTFVPDAPSTTTPALFLCSGDASAMLDASPIPLPLSQPFTLNLIDSYGDGWNGNTITVFVDGIPVLNSVTLPSGTNGSLTFAVNEGSVVTTQFNYVGFYPEECFFDVLDETMTVVGSGDQFSNTTPYVVPMAPYSIEWYDASTGGLLIGAGSPFESVGSVVLPNTTSTGAYSFFASVSLDGCSSPTTEMVVSVSEVNVDFTTTPVSCNNGNDGGLLVNNVICGTAPFTYSIDGGSFGPAPVALTIGAHDVIVKDNGGLLSGTYSVIIGDAPAPVSLAVDAFDYDMVEFSWAAGGTEALWYVEWGLSGFAPGTGSEIGSSVVVSPTEIVTGLDGFTDYDFYVAANCGGATTAGTWVLVSQTTLCDPMLAQGFCESFDSSSPTQACWTLNDENGDFYAWEMDNSDYPYNGDESAAIYTDGNGGFDDDWLITPLFTLTNNEIMSFYYAVYETFEPNSFEVLLSTTGQDPADFSTVLLANATYNNEAYLNQTIDLTAYAGDCYIAFHVPGGIDGWVLYIDDFCIDICSPDAGTDGATDACILDGTLDLNTVITQGETNGVWEFIPNPGVVSGSDLNLSLLPNGTYDLEYIVTTACTTDTTIASVTVHSASTAGNDGTLDDYCTNWSSINLVDAMTGTIDLGGVWTNVSGEGTLSGSQWTPGLTTLAGSYDFVYVVSNGFCPNDTATVTVNLISCVGIDETTNYHLVVYPNPVNDELTIANLSIENALLQVFDVQGKLINTVQLNGVYGNYKLDMQNIERGMYVVRITSENTVQEVRVVKQ